ncbi:interleukin-23 receptor isoform X3 [Pezoporus occidentalis]|uniref:interleukin-23 receptor isoform X3 n=1 Tax=Pezoporus occidentalis TaxID=407982 RepID=UPI002F917B6D
MGQVASGLLPGADTGVLNPRVPTGSFPPPPPVSTALPDPRAPGKSLPRIPIPTSGMVPAHPRVRADAAARGSGVPGVTAPTFPPSRLCHVRAVSTARAMAGSSEALALHILLCCLCAGVANIRCSGHVWIEPAPVVRMGTNISINCISTLGCPWAKFRIFFNYSHAEGTPAPLNSSSVQLRLREFRMPFGSVTCFARCPNTNMYQLVCGTTVLAGYPPDPPSNLTCAIQERSGHMACTWDTGQTTHLPTQYTLHLRRVRTAVTEDAKEDDDDEEEEKVFPAGSLVPVSSLHGGNHYSAWVQASNMLGAARSAPQHLNLQQLVIPALPLLTGAETTESSAPITTIHWKRQTLLGSVRCEERHKATGSAAWQVRCRLSAADSPWSAWSSPFLYTTPEAAPAAAPDVWRRLGPAFPNGSHEVTVLIKPLAPQDARGRILGYSVTAEIPAGRVLLCNTSSTGCSVLVPPGARTLRVTAHNSKGASSPANITLTQGSSSLEEFPAPVAVEVKPENQSKVLVAWQPPSPSRRPPLWFIVEWVSTTPYSPKEQYFWKKVPYQATYTDIQAEAGAGGHINVSVYAVYPDGASKPSSSQVPAEDQLLESTYGSTYSELSHDDDIGLFLGLGISVVVLSVVVIILMFKKSARKRIHALVVSILPKWLFEDIPHMENSNMVKLLQKNSDFLRNSLHEPFVDTRDPAVMEVEEVPAHEEYKNIVTRRNPSREIPKDGELKESTVPATAMPFEHISDYKPQVSDGNALGYVAANIYQTQPPASLPEPETNLFFRDYTSPFPHTWDGEGGGHHVCLLEHINLVLSNSQSGQSHTFSSAQAGCGSILDNQWGHAAAGEVQEQMLVPDELLSCLRATNGQSVDINPCFPQNIGRLL